MALLGLIDDKFGDVVVLRLKFKSEMLKVNYCEFTQKILNKFQNYAFLKYNDAK